MTQEQVKIRHDNDVYCNDAELVKWYNVYKKHKAQKSIIKEELIPIAWHPSIMQDW